MPPGVSGDESIRRYLSILMKFVKYVQQNGFKSILLNLDCLQWLFFEFHGDKADISSIIMDIRDEKGIPMLIDISEFDYKPFVVSYKKEWTVTNISFDEIKQEIITKAKQLMKEIEALNPSILESKLIRNHFKVDLDEIERFEEPI